MASSQLTFTGMPLLRRADKRKNDAWVESQVNGEDACFIFSCKSKVLLNNNSLALFNNIQSRPLQALAHAKIFLGTCKTTYAPIFFIDCSLANDEKLEKALAQVEGPKGTLSWLPLRLALTQMDQHWAAICGYGNALANWHLSHKFCGYCGGNLLDKEGGHAKQCENEACTKLVFPRTDPVVIMLVEHTDEQGIRRCLLAGHQRTSGQVVSTLAGFVDPGESIEEAVIREINEEVGLQAAQVEYITSQPWPFPNSLMLGFRVTVEDADLTIDKDELTHAMWCTADEISGFDDWGAEAEGTQIPGKQSIARFLIDNWCRQVNVESEL